MLGIVTTVTNRNYSYLEEFVAATKEFNLNIHIFNLGTYTNDAIIGLHRKTMREKLDTEIKCLEGYNTGYNKGIDGQKLFDILKTIHESDFTPPPRVKIPADNRPRAES
jgi:hypothetical protein